MVVDDKPAAAGAISPRMTSRQVGIVAAVAGVEPEIAVQPVGPTFAEQQIVAAATE